jgi:putative tryptophan/tyrosine transport system substrate-binding protein
MDRRRFLVTSLAGALAGPRAARAQQAGKVPRVVLFCAVYCDVGLMQRSPTGKTLLEALARHGYEDGRNIIIDERWAGVAFGALREKAMDLVRQQVHIILAVESVAAVQAARSATSTIPIIMVAVPDPEETGLVQSLRRPGRNITGLGLPYLSLAAKHIALIRELLPTASRVGIFWNPDNPDHERLRAIVRGAAGTAGLESREFTVRRAHDIRPTFDVAVKWRPHGLILLDDAVLYRGEIWQMALTHRLPTVGLDAQVARAGGLMSYGPSRTEMYAQSAEFIDRILRGTPPAELPVQEPRKYELVISGPVARALGLTIPPSLLAQADHVIE